MVSTFKTIYEEIKKTYIKTEYNDILHNDEILLFYPDYYKTKVSLEKERFMSKQVLDRIFERNYKDSDLYNNLSKVALKEEDIYTYMKKNMEVKYRNMKVIYNKLLDSSIMLCELIDYIGHYPENEEDKKENLEELLDKYDIFVDTLPNDYHKCIFGEDIIRIIEKLNANLGAIEVIKEKLKNNKWLFTKQLSNDNRKDNTMNILEKIDDFPLSRYQREGKKIRNEETYNLKLIHHNYIDRPLWK